MHQNFQELVDLCQDRRIFIQTHNSPDPDAIGSGYGLQGLLERFGVKSTLCYDGYIDKLSAGQMVEVMSIDIYSSMDLDITPDDAIICVDSQKSGGNITDLPGTEIACIDHHPTYVAASYGYKDVRRVGSCSTIIAGYYKELGVEPTPKEACALLHGLRIDTLQLSRGVTDDDIDAFSFLFEYADKQKLARLERNSVAFSDLAAYSAAIENIRIYASVGITDIEVPCPNALIGILSDFLLTLEEVDIAIVSSHRDDGIRFSVRSRRDDVDAGKLVRAALEGIGEGGGHAQMAGGLIPRENEACLGLASSEAVRMLFLHQLEPIMGELALRHMNR